MRDIKVERLTYGMMVREGAGVKLHRYIGIERTDEFEPLLLLDYFDSSNPMDFMAGFPPHPHRGFETITYLLDGSITHEDNKGHKGTIGPGDVQWMTAASGVLHKEFHETEWAKEGGIFQMVQLWVNLPAKDKMSPPKYQAIANEEMTKVDLGENGHIEIIAGNYQDQIS